MTPALLLSMLLTLAGGPPAGPWDSPAYPAADDYTRIVGRFPRYAERGWHGNYGGDTKVGYFGDGRSDENGQRTLANFTLTYAWLATNAKYDPALSGVSLATVKDHALAAIRYRLRTHVVGDLKCTDDKPWGNHWQSAWWVSRMVPAVLRLKADLTPAELALFDKVVQHEASRHIGLKPRYQEYGDTKAEENAWDAEVVAWALNLYPRHEKAPGWRAALDTLCFNTFSVTADLSNTTLVDGKPINQWIGGPSIHPDYTIENHGPFHICYQICPQHSMGWVWYAYASHQRAAPAAVYHNLPQVWSRLKQFALWNGRFAYVGGKDWPRYAYGMYFILPALVHMQTVYGDADARLIERLRVGTFEREQLVWNDGSFFSGRFTKGIMERWPSEWETDCAANLTIAAMMHELKDPPHPTSREVLAAKNVGTFVSPYCELAMRRDPQRLVGWCWRSIGGPVTGMVCSDTGEDMLEWNHSLAGNVAFGDRTKPGTTVAHHHETTFEGGFASVGEVRHGAADRPPSPLRLELQDDNIPLGSMADPKHPLFTTPNQITSLTGLTDLDSVAKAGPGWTVLARNTRGGPSLFEAKLGTGKFVVSMTNLDEKAAAGDPLAKALFANLLAYARAPGRRCGYVAGEAHLKNALDAAKVKTVAISTTGSARGAKLADQLAAIDVLFIDRTATAAAPHYGTILDWVAKGGIVVNSVLQDDKWNPETINTAPTNALRQRIACVALPDGRTTLLISEWSALADVQVKSLDLLDWRLGNDIFNDRRRTITTTDATTPSLELRGLDLPAERTLAVPGRGFKVDGDLMLASLGDGDWEVLDTPQRLATSLCTAVVRLKPAGVGAARAGQVVARGVVALRTRADLGGGKLEGQVDWKESSVSVATYLTDGKPCTVAIDWAKDTATLR
ncbi:MAG: hypothetical protein HZB16_18045 [Armatimonadetes bacterium]|nr:hypothetical protein [Armatimonadota bacterium]